MNLAELFGALNRPRIWGSLNREVTDVVYDSRKVGKGALFVAVRGFQRDGHEYIKDAVSRGAVGVVVEEGWPGLGPVVEDLSGRKEPEVFSLISVAESRKALSVIADRFYGSPSRRLGLIGVTGTNGKTTTTHLIRGILQAAGLRCGLLGTVGYDLGAGYIPAQHTTPESADLHRLLRDMVEAGLEYAVMEVSSHALAMDRVADCAFDLAVFTNFTQDHLDFHGSMQQYLKAKLKLFSALDRPNPKSIPRMAVVNGDDPRADEVRAATRAPTWTFGNGPGSDLWAGKIRIGFDGLRFLAHTPRGQIEIQSGLTGRYNVSNILAAIGVGLVVGIPGPTVRKGILETPQVPGRFERVDEGQPFLVIVDYAHTEDALRQLLQAARGLLDSEQGGRGRLITVFGCGGDRDRGKRPKMGMTAAQLSTEVFLTSDNPRTEDPKAILVDVEAGVRKGCEDGGLAQTVHVIEDRAQAIGAAIEAARSGDIVVIAGKGHEDYQLIGTTRHPFDDRRVAREAIRRVRSKRR